MKNTGPIIVVEDDLDDQYIMGVAFNRLNYLNNIVYFDDGLQAYEYLISSGVRPFLILSDINMPVLSGLELKEKINAHKDLRLKCTPYIFFSTSSSPTNVLQAYSDCAQGYFMKPTEIEQLVSTIRKIVEYWDESFVPEV